MSLRPTCHSDPEGNEGEESHMATSTEKIQVSLRDYLQIIFRRKKFFLLPFIIIFLTATIGSFFLPRYYQSSAMILIEEEEVVNPLVRDVYRSPAPALDEQIMTLSSQILSFPHLITAIRKLGLDKGITSPLAYEELVRGIRKRADIKMRALDVFQISYEDKRPGLSQRLVNTLIEIFIEDATTAKKKRVLVGVEFATAQAELYKKALEESENALYEFKKKYPLQLPGRETSVNVDMLINYQTSLTSVEMALNEAEKELNLLRRQISGQEPVIISSDMINLNPIVNRLYSKLEDLQLRLDTLLTEDPGSPEILDVQLEIEDTREKLRLETEKSVDIGTVETAPLFYQRLKQKFKDAQEDVDKLKVRKEKLEGLVKEYEIRIGTLSEQEREYVRLMRDASVNRNIYEMLLMKAEENRLTAEEMKEKGTRYEIIEDARMPLRPSKPRKLLIGIVAFIIGGLSGFGCVFLAEFSDHSFHGVEDAKKFLGLPILGSIAKITNREEIAAQKAREKRTTIILIGLFLLLIVTAIVSSFIQERKITQEIIETEIWETSPDVDNR